jgi:hypothetical protein
MQERPYRAAIAFAGDVDDDQHMGSWLWVVLGVILVLVGAVWTLQGIGVLGGSVMSGVTLWAIVGPVVAVIGLALVWRGLRQRRV